MDICIETYFNIFVSNLSIYCGLLRDYIYDNFNYNIVIYGLNLIIINCIFYYLIKIFNNKLEKINNKIEDKISEKQINNIKKLQVLEDKLIKLKNEILEKQLYNIKKIKKIEEELNNKLNKIEDKILEKQLYNIKKFEVIENDIKKIIILVKKYSKSQNKIISKKIKDSDNKLKNIISENIDKFGVFKKELKNEIEKINSSINERRSGNISRFEIIEDKLNNLLQFKNHNIIPFGCSYLDFSSKKLELFITVHTDKHHITKFDILIDEKLYEYGRPIGEKYDGSDLLLDTNYLINIFKLLIIDNVDIYVNYIYHYCSYHIPEKDFIKKNIELKNIYNKIISMIIEVNNNIQLTIISNIKSNTSKIYRDKYSPELLSSSLINSFIDIDNENIVKYNFNNESEINKYIKKKLKSHIISKSTFLDRETNPILKSDNQYIKNWFDSHN